MKEGKHLVIETLNVHITPYDLERRMFIYLPDDVWSSGKRYPVIYMFDGHNLFFDSTATYGTCWGMKEYMDAHPQAIVVAPECNHEGNKRLEEYSPYCFTQDGFGTVNGTGRQFMDWLTEELKPMIDARYPTRTDRANTAIGGSSMGGLMSLYAITAYNTVFSKAACLSPALSFNLAECMDEAAHCEMNPDTRVYFGWGQAEMGSEQWLAVYTADLLEMCRVLGEKGAVICPYLQLGGRHCEADWRKQLPQCFHFLFGWQ